MLYSAVATQNSYRNEEILMKHRSSLSIAIAAILMGLTGTASAQAIPDNQSPEFKAMGTLGAINVYPAWSAGALGQDVTVALLDSGVRASHFELQGRIATGGKDFVDGDNDPNDTSAQGHGTSMASIIAGNFNNKGIVGIAYQAKVLPIRVVQEEGQTANTANRVKGINFAANRPDVRVLVSSYQSSANQAETNAFKNAGAKGKVVVIAAGNNERSNPDFPASILNALGGAGIAVGATNPDGKTLAGFSDRAGRAKNFFMVAPGLVNAASNASNGAFITRFGTSMAAPQVAAAAAVLLSHAPNLSNVQVAQLLLNNATDLGEPGVDEVFGHGRLNVAKALSAQGPVEGPDEGGSSSGLGAAAAAVAVGAGVVYWLTKKQKAKKQLENTLVLDSYDRPYIMNMNDAIYSRNDGPKLFDVMDMFDRQTRSMNVPLSDNINATMYTSTIDTSDYIYLKDSDPFMQLDEQVYSENLSLKLNGSFENGLSFNVQTNQAPGSDFDKVNDLSLSEQFVMGSSLTNAYMGFGASADSMSVGYRYNERYSLSVGANRIDDEESHGLNSSTKAVQGTYRHDERSSLSLRLSEISENGSLLGGASNGVLSVSRAKTTALGLTANHKLLDKLSLFANYTHGFTNVDEQRGSFLQDFSGLQSHSYSVGLLGNNLVNYKDKAGIAISSPMRISDGGVTLVVPHSIDYSTGSVYRTSDRLDMSDAPAGLDFETFYNMPVNRYADVGTYFTYRDRPATETNDDNEIAVFATVGVRF